MPYRERQKNPDLVENVSKADINVPRCHKADGAIVERHAERNHYNMVMSIQRACTEREIEKTRIW